uniref:Uncharacterized protein n=1 Tax=Anguilla anguilla TaxID=7936 RepID=A0A0E9RFW5_ANGAN
MLLFKQPVCACANESRPRSATSLGQS